MNSKKPCSEPERVIRAFGYSYKGLRFACTHPAFRLELLTSLIMIPLAMFLTESSVERVLLIGSVMLVLIVVL